ncbi:uncharacterized protein LOC128217711 [Mya arenaria]|uniref:uncharacterized protein LOC128217711 n=1 Tax=Mya arenaria TaxID=6604 RepID=UPI0022E571C0|nr:uncharacterized protein LOC128217711 [Mya arenaria]
MKTKDNYKSYTLRREGMVYDSSLTSAKRRYIESWRQSVSVFMEAGNICKVTVGDVTPEPKDVSKWPNIEPTRPSRIEHSPAQEMASPTLPAVKFSYSHVPDDVIRQHQRQEKCLHRVQTDSRSTLPPSPNGFAVQNGHDLQQSYKRRTSAMRATSSTVKMELPDVVQDTKDVTTKSSKLAREIYEKYNMKNKSHNLLTPGKNTQNGIEHYSMPWRNKTFLTLPLRFNGTANSGLTRFGREKTNITELRSDTSDLDENFRFEKDWEDGRHW